MWLHDYKNWPELEAKFIKDGYTIEADLSNSLIIEKGGDWVDYDELPEHLRDALDQFVSDNGIEC